MKIDNSKILFFEDDTSYKDWDPSKPLPQLTPEQKRKIEKSLKQIEKKYFGA